MGEFYVSWLKRSVPIVSGGGVFDIIKVILRCSPNIIVYKISTSGNSNKNVQDNSKSLEMLNLERCNRMQILWISR